MPSSSRSPLLGATVAGAAQVTESQDTIKAQPSDGVVGGGRVSISGMAVVAGAVAQAAAGGGSPAPEVSPGGATNVMIEEVASDDPASSAGPAGGASSSTVAADDGAGVLPVVILGHPMLRAPGDVSLNEAKGAAHGDVLCRESGGIIDE
jgi:hypothetical protein